MMLQLMNDFIYVYTEEIQGSGVATPISEGDIFISSCSAQLISFEIKSILKEVNCTEQKYMNMSPSLIELATPLIQGAYMQAFLRGMLIYCS